MTTNTAGLSLKEAAAKAEAELALTDESTEPVSSVDSESPAPVVEQPAVETETETGLFDSLVEQPEQPVLDSEELYEVNGEMVSLDQLRAGYMMQADYTQKTQELAEEKREAEKALTLLRLLEERPVATIRKLYEQINTGAPLTGTDEISLSTQPSDQPQAPTDIESLVEARVAEMLENDPRLVTLQQERALAQINDIFGEIEEMYQVSLTDADKRLVLQTAQDMNTTDIKFVFGGLMNQANQKQVALQNAKSVTPTAPEYVPPRDQGPAVPQKFDSFRSAVNAALAAEQGA
jgi:hypothetical protein